MSTNISYVLIRLKSQAAARQIRSDDCVTAVKAGVRKTPLARSYSSRNLLFAGAQCPGARGRGWLLQARRHRITPGGDRPN